MKYPILIALCLIGCKGFSQHPILSSFTFNNVDAGISLSFVIAGGNTCNGIDVFHKVGDTGVFKLAGQIPGICGHSSNDTRYDYVHEKPSALDTNYYYLDFGGVGPSDPVKIYYVPFNGGEMVISQSIASLTVFLNNPAFSGAQVSLYNINGGLIANESAQQGRAKFSTLPTGQILIVHVQNAENQVLVQKVLSVTP